jgi:amidase
MSHALLGSATDAAEAIRRKEVSSRELTAAVLARIADVDPAINAVVELRRDEARRDAEAADRRTADGGLGPLHGVPITVKEAFDVAGLHTTWGNSAFRDYVAATDATVVARLRRAGAVIVGKTNAHEMLADFAQTANRIYGRTKNPWDRSRSPGGSSGGAAAALTAGMTFLDYGSDLVGSIRIPASFCGVYGLKPSVGIVPLSGFQPPGAPAAPSETSYMSSAGPLARAARDVRAALAATAGPEPPAASAYTWRLAPPRRTRLEDFCVGVVLDDERAPVATDVAAPLSDAVDALSRAGATIVDGWPEGIDPGAVAESFEFHVGLFLARQQRDGGFAGLERVIEHERRRTAARAAWDRYFDQVDVFLCPTNFTAAIPHDDRPFDQRTVETPQGERPYDQQAFWISHASLPGLPSLSAPIGTTARGLPVGIQIVGPPFEDDTAITFADRLADVVGGFRPSPFHAPETSPNAC